MNLQGQMRSYYLSSLTVLGSDIVVYTGPSPTPPTLTFHIRQPTPIAIRDLGNGAYYCEWCSVNDPQRIRNVFELTVSGAPPSEVQFVQKGILHGIIRQDMDLNDTDTPGLATPVSGYRVLRFEPDASGGIYPVNTPVGYTGPSAIANDTVDVGPPGVPRWEAQGVITQLQSIYGVARGYVATEDWIAY